MLALDEGIPARRRQGAYWLVLIGCAAALAFGALEAASRLAYHFEYLSLTSTYNSLDARLKAEWLRRHRRTGVVGQYGYDTYDPLLGWTLRPNLRDLRVDRQPGVTTNADGIRADREFSHEKPPGVRRVVLVGDSFTFGEDEEQAHIWPSLLQANLPGWEVLNLGVHGYGTDQMLLTLQTKGMRYHPDVVVVSVFVEDVDRNVGVFRAYAKPMFVLDEGQLRLTNVPVPSPEELLAQDDGVRPASYAWHFLTHELGPVYGSTERKNDRPYVLGLNRAIMDEMRRTAAGGGANLLVVVVHYPAYGETLEVEASVEAWGREVGSPVLDLRGAFEASDAGGGPKLWARHFSRVGNALVAQTVRERLRELGWAP